MGSAPCRSCGQPLRAGVRVCTHCGVPVWTTDPSAGSAQPPTPIPAGAAPPVYFVQTVPQPVTTTPPIDEQRKVIRLKGGHVALLAGIAALLLVGAVAAGAMTTPESKPIGDLVGELPFGPEGGTQAFDEGAGEIEVPKDALDEPETITVYRTVVRDRVTARSPTGLPLAFPAGTLIAYTFGPTTIVLNSPVTITLRIPVVDQGGLVFVTANGQIRFYPGDVSGRTITFQLSTFDLTRPGAIVVSG